MIQSTSREAYYLEIKPTLAERQEAVYNMLRSRTNMTNSELRVALGVEINTITPRTNELVEMGLVRKGPKRQCTVTGRKVIAWEVNKTTLF